MARPPAAPPASADEIEQAFYEAMQRADLERMMAVWSDDDEIACIHPGGLRLVGAAAIRASFEAMFTQGPVPATPERVRRLVSHDCAIHHVLERVRVTTPEGEKSGWVVATNVYVKTPLGWRMALHHASPAAADDVQEISAAPSVLH